MIKEAAIVMHIIFAATLLSMLTGCGAFDGDNDETEPSSTSDGPVIGMTVPAVQSPNMTPELCAAIIRTLSRPARPGLHFFYGIFGYEEACLKSYTEANKHRRHTLRVAAIDESFRDGDASWTAGRLWRERTTEDLNNDFKTETRLEDFYPHLRLVSDMLARVVNENTDVIVVVFNEHTLEDAAAINAARLADILLPYEIQLNPVHTWMDVHPYKRELHGKNLFCDSRTHVLSQDGTHFSAVETYDFVANNLNCDEVYVWPYELQGINYIDGKLVRQPGPLPDRKLSYTHEEEYSELFSKIL